MGKCKNTNGKCNDKICHCHRFNPITGERPSEQDCPFCDDKSPYYHKQTDQPTERESRPKQICSHCLKRDCVCPTTEIEPIGYVEQLNFKSHVSTINNPVMFQGEVYSKEQFQSLLSQVEELKKSKKSILENYHIKNAISLEAKLAEAVGVINTALLQITDLDDVLNHDGHEVFGWHQNGDGESVTSFFEENDHDAVNIINKFLTSLQEPKEDKS